MKLDKEDSLLAMRILLIKNKKNDVLDEEQFLEDVYTLLLSPVDKFLDLLEVKLSDAVYEMSPEQDKIFVDELEKDYLAFTKKIKL
jgi:hypothetical protein